MSTRPYLAADDRRRALLDAAHRLFERGGFAAMTMVAVAAEAGVSRALVYKHFPDQASLYIAMFEDRAEQFILGAPRPGGDTGTEQAASGFATALRISEGELRTLRTVLAADGDPELQPLRDRVAEHLWQRWSPLFDPPREESIARVTVLAIVAAALDFGIAVHEGRLTAEMAEQVWTGLVLGAASALPPAG